MTDPTQNKGNESRQPQRDPQDNAVGEDPEAIENDPAVERGERIATGKNIGSSGDPDQYVPGTEPTD